MSEVMQKNFETEEPIEFGVEIKLYQFTDEPNNLKFWLNIDLILQRMEYLLIRFTAENYRIMLGTCSYVLTRQLEWGSKLCTTFKCLKLIKLQNLQIKKYKQLYCHYDSWVAVGNPIRREIDA